MAGFFSLREAQAQKRRVKDERDAEHRLLMKGMAKLAERGNNIENDISDMIRIHERKRSAFRVALRELRRMAVAASPASSVIPIAVLGAHESPTMIVAAGVCECRIRQFSVTSALRPREWRRLRVLSAVARTADPCPAAPRPIAAAVAHRSACHADLLADGALFQQYIMGPLLQVARSGSGLGRGGVAIAGTNSPVDPEEIAQFGFVLSELTERGVAVLLKWTEWLVKTDAGLNLASISKWKQPLTPTPVSRFGAADKSPFVFSVVIDCVLRWLCSWSLLPSRHFHPPLRSIQHCPLLRTCVRDCRRHTYRAVFYRAGPSTMPRRMTISTLAPYRLRRTVRNQRSLPSKVQGLHYNSSL